MQENPQLWQRSIGTPTIPYLMPPPHHGHGSAEWCKVIINACVPGKDNLYPILTSITYLWEWHTIMNMLKCSSLRASFFMWWHTQNEGTWTCRYQGPHSKHVRAIEFPNLSPLMTNPSTLTTVSLIQASHGYSTSRVYCTWNLLKFYSGWGPNFLELHTCTNIVSNGTLICCYIVFRLHWVGCYTTDLLYHVHTKLCKNWMKILPVQGMCYTAGKWRIHVWIARGNAKPLTSGNV